jgi:hypothetical protein
VNIRGANLRNFAPFESIPVDTGSGNTGQNADFCRAGPILHMKHRSPALEVQILMNKILILLCAIVLVSASNKLVKTKINDEITVSLPTGFFAMSPEDIAQRLPSVRAPLGAYTNEDRVIDFSVNVSATQWPDANQEIAAKFFKSSLYNLYDKVEMIEEGIHEVHKKKYIYFEFESRINANRRVEGGTEPLLKYTYIQYLVEEGRTLVFSFSCPRTMREEWQPISREVMKSIKVK